MWYEIAEGEKESREFGLFESEDLFGFFEPEDLFLDWLYAGLWEPEGHEEVQ